MTRTRTSVLGATFFLLAGALALTLVLLTGRSSGGNQVKLRLGAGAAGAASKETSAGEGPVGGYEAYVSASRTYPANVISPAIVKRAQTTFNRLAKRDARFAKTARGRHFLDNNGGKWEQYGPRTFGLEPGVISFSGATNVTSSRTVAIVADPDCTASKCRVWAGNLGRRRLDDGQHPRAGPGVAADEPGAARPELGRAAGARSHRQEARHALPRDR